MIESKSRVAIYCRLSEEDRNKQSETDDSNSIQNQKSMLLQYSLEHGWEVYNIYSDDDYTGSDRRRPEFNRLLEDAKNRKFDIVLCKTQSRFTRELELVEKYIHGLFPIWGIRFISIVDNADTKLCNLAAISMRGTGLRIVHSHIEAHNAILRKIVGCGHIVIGRAGGKAGHEGCSHKKL